MEEKKVKREFSPFDRYIDPDNGETVWMDEDYWQMLQPILYNFFLFHDCWPTIFIGNGLTQVALSENNGVPTSWSEVLESNAKSSKIDPDIIENNKDNPVLLAALVARHRPDLTLLKQQLDNPHKNVNNARVHQVIVDIAHEHAQQFPDSVSHVITTNYDSVLEKAFFKSRMSDRTCVNVGVNMMKTKPNTQVLIHKIHGSSEPPRERLNRYNHDKPPSGPDFWANTMVLSEPEYIQCGKTLLGRLSSTKLNDWSLYQAASRPMVFVGKGLYSEDVTPNWLMVWTREARIALWEKYVQTAALPENLPRKLPSRVSGIYIQIGEPDYKEIGKLMNIGLLALVAPRCSSYANLEYAELFQRSLAALFNKRPYPSFPGFDDIFQRPKFVAIGVAGHANFVDVSNTLCQSTTCVADELELETPASPAVTVSRTFGSLSRMASSLVSMLPLNRPADFKILKTFAPKHQMQTRMVFRGWPRGEPNNDWRTTYVMPADGTRICLESSVAYSFEPTHANSLQADVNNLSNALPSAETSFGNQSHHRSPFACNRIHNNPPPATLSDKAKERLRKWDEQIDRAFAGLNEVKLVYLDRFFFLHGEFQNKLENPVCKLLTRFLDRSDIPDMLLETGCASSSKQLELPLLYSTIVSAGWNFFSKVRAMVIHQEVSCSLPALMARGTAPIAMTMANFERDKQEIDDYLTRYLSQGKSTWDEQRTLRHVADVLFKHQEPHESKRRQWLVVTLRHRGAIWYDRRTDKSGFVPTPWIGPYTVLTGDVFRGAFASEFIKQHPNPSLECCVKEAVRVSALKTLYVGVDEFYQNLEACSTQLREWPKCVRAPRKEMPFPRKLMKNFGRVAVVGAGIIGLTTALRLIDAGYVVDVFSKHDRYRCPVAPGKHTEIPVASYAAAAFWLPFMIPDPELRGPLMKCCQDTLEEWRKFCQFEPYKTWASDVIQEGICEIIDTTWEAHPWFQDPEFQTKVECRKITSSKPNSEQTVNIQFKTLLFQVREIMDRLRDELEYRGRALGQIMFHKLEITNKTGLEELSKLYDVVVNCTGLGSQSLLEDQDLQPVRGDLLVGPYPPTWTEEEKCPTTTPRVLIYEGCDCHLSYVVCHKERIVVGGTVKSPQDTLAVDRYAEQRPFQKEIIENCKQRLPKEWTKKLEQLDFDQFEYTVGYRPARRGQPRLERECGTKIIHNYGHAGSGWSLCWGYSLEVVKLISQDCGVKPSIDKCGHFSDERLAHAVVGNGNSTVRNEISNVQNMVFVQGGVQATGPFVGMQTGTGRERDGNGTTQEGGERQIKKQKTGSKKDRK